MGCSHDSSQACLSIVVGRSSNYRDSRLLLFHSTQLCIVLRTGTARNALYTGHAPDSARPLSSITSLRNELSVPERGKHCPAVAAAFKLRSSRKTPGVCHHGDRARSPNKNKEPGTPQKNSRNKNTGMVKSPPLACFPGDA